MDHISSNDIGKQFWTVWKGAIIPVKLITLNCTVESHNGDRFCVDHSQLAEDPHTLAERAKAQISSPDKSVESEG